MDTNTGANGVIDILAEQTSTFTSGTDLFFTSTSGDIDYQSMFGDFTTTSRGNTQMLATSSDNGRIVMEASGISRNSETAIRANANGNAVMGAPEGTITINAWESIELLTNEISAISIGYVPDVVPPTTGTTTLFANGIDADIIFNVVESQYGLGSVNILSGNPVADQEPDSTIDFIAVEKVRFEQESGLSFAGFNEIRDTVRPADIFFISSGAGAGIKVATDERAALSDIDIEVDAAIFDADQELRISSNSPHGAATKFQTRENLPGPDIGRIDRLIALS
eukprot:TRINITY_DN31650_c0_g1_i1.p1 TRINITY_DN31650_c0_g1~~TRINITY_DN31650_c0_g1_i1.p1  ORF type:complete len:330 (-),score=41.20 TRINITY_DN31650_c0_g1_i1:53-895(-)